MKKTKNTSNEPRTGDFSFKYSSGYLTVVAVIILLDLVFIAMLGLKVEKSCQREAKVEPTVLEKNLSHMVYGHPIEEMVPFLAKEKKETLAFLVAIAKKESNWGKFSPKKNGRECYNYWGYRGTYNQTRSGYSCFDSPEQAVSVVGKRINELLAQRIDTPNEMVVWKCGHICETHNPYAVRKWINDVDFYFRKVENL